MEVFDPNKEASYYYNKYVEIYKKYDLLNTKTQIKAEKQRKASFEYVQKKRLNTYKTCPDCNIELCVDSYNSHLKSKKHLKQVEFNQNIIKSQINNT